MFDSEKYYIEYTNDFESISITCFFIKWDDPTNFEQFAEGTICTTWSYVVWKDGSDDRTVMYTDYIAEEYNSLGDYDENKTTTTRGLASTYISNFSNCYWELSDDETLIANICAL
jgi:hypothetical protein